MLAKQHPAKLSERIRWIVERLEAHLAIGDRQSENLRLTVVAVLELLRRLVETGVTGQLRQRENVLIAYRDPRVPSA